MMNKGFIIYCVSALLISGLLLGQVSAQWHAQYYRDHPLVGKIYSTVSQQWITESQLKQALLEKQFLLLGETHTNPDHHYGQARLLQQWIDNDKPVALVFEMLAYDDWADQRLPMLELAELTAELEQVAKRWDWKLYEPVLRQQIKYQLPMVGGNLTRQQLDEFSSDGVCEFARGGLSLDVCNLLDSQQEQAIKKLIFDAHCEYLPMAHTQPLMKMQIAKDASFAISMVNNAKSHRIALIAGAVHVRKDIGVPVHLQKLGYSVDETVLSIAFVNVQPGMDTPQDYFDAPELSKQYDYLLFTPSERNQDPCVEFSEQLKKMKHSKTKH